MRRILAIFLLIFSFSLIFAGVVEAEEQKVVVLESDEVVDKDYFAAGDKVSIHGTVNGDVYVGAGEVVIDGVVNGDVLAAGGMVKISGEVSQDVRVGGGDIQISGKIGGNLTAIGGNVTVMEEAEIVGSLVAGAGVLEINGLVGGNIVAGVGVLEILGEVGGDVSYWSENEAKVDGAEIGGIVKKNDPAFQVPEERFEGFGEKFAKFGKTASFAGKLINLFSALLIGLLLIRFCPKYLRSAAGVIDKQPWKALGLGFAVLFLTPIAFVILLITIVGAPLAFISLAIWMILLYLSKILVSFWLGKIFLEKMKTKQSGGLILLVGLTIYTLASMVPVLSGLVGLFGLLFGLGAGILALKQIHPPLVKKA